MALSASGHAGCAKVKLTVLCSFGSMSTVAQSASASLGPIKLISSGANHVYMLLRKHATAQSVVHVQDGNPAKQAVQSLSMAVSRGECFGLLGPNGAGKVPLLAPCPAGTFHSARICSHNFTAQFC